MKFQINNKLKLYIFFLIFTLFCNIVKSKKVQKNLYFNVRLHQNNINLTNYFILINNQTQQLKSFKKIMKKPKLLLECSQLRHSNYLSTNDLERACKHRNMWLKDAFYLNKTFTFNLTGLRKLFFINKKIKLLTKIKNIKNNKLINCSKALLYWVNI